ncbi:MAG: hypothetical protein ACRBG0_21640 [Lewinella sp.]|uniref:hypothetical protein n=1 Tax=Lewinella sp. TaxID=2004506 RepID=UPI003D6B8E3E
MNNLKIIMTVLTLLTVICTPAAGQGLDDPWGVGLGPGPENPFDMAVSVRKYFSTAQDGREHFVQLSIHALSLKSFVEESIGSALGQTRFAFGRENGWTNDWYVAVGGGVQKYLFHRQKKLRLYVEVVGAVTYEQYRARNNWVQHQDVYIAYSKATYAVYHASLTGAIGYKIPLYKGINLFVAPLSLRADIALVSVPTVDSPQALDSQPSKGLKLIQGLSSIDRKTGLNSELNLFDGPIILIRFTL